MRTQATLDGLVAALVANCGDILGACKTVGCSPMFLKRWRAEDEKTNEAITEAIAVGAMGLESAAIERAVRGVDKAIYYKGEVAGYETQYSDGLLQTLLKARVPGFQTGEGGGTTFTGPTQINIMPRAESYEQWLSMKQVTLAKASEKLPAPDVQLPSIIEEAEFTPVSPLAGLGI